MTRFTTCFRPDGPHKRLMSIQDSIQLERRGVNVDGCKKVALTPRWHFIEQCWESNNVPGRRSFPGNLPGEGGADFGKVTSDDNAIRSEEPSAGKRGGSVGRGASGILKGRFLRLDSRGGGAKQAAIHERPVKAFVIGHRPNHGNCLTIYDPKNKDLQLLSYYDRFIYF